MPRSRCETVRSPHRPIRTPTSFCVSDFDLAVTVRSGQVFRWREETSVQFSGWINFRPVRLRQKGRDLLAEGASPAEIERFFDLTADFPSIARSIDVDPILHEALQAYWGLRLIRQDPWECLASFILSSFNNIPRITGMIERLCVEFGTPAMGPVEARDRSRSTARTPHRGVRILSRLRSPSLRSGTVATQPARGLLSPTPHLGSHLSALCCFPKPEVLANVPERVLRDLGLGFRAPYLKAAAQAVAGGKADLEGWNALDDEGLRNSLLGIPGVGEKIVECVMLFAYGRTSAFPVDVWIGRAMRRWYFRGRKVPDRKIREFARKHFGPHCGWAQQYLYCHARGASARISLERTEPSKANS